MPDRTMTPQEMRDYMTETNIASLATLKPDGSPHLAPVWYEYAGEKLYIITGNSTVKARNILRDPRVSMAIATPGEPYKYVLIEGDAEITRSDLEMTTTSLCVRYRGRRGDPRFAREVLEAGDTIVIVVVPTKIVTWVEGEAA